MSRLKKGIYCLEVGEWFGTLKKKHSVEPVLQLLRDSLLAVPYIHRDIATQVELLYYLKKWTQGRHRDYPILYLAFHGEPGRIKLCKQNGRGTDFDTEDLFAELQGKCHKRIIHFGACSVLDMHGHIVNRYLRDSDAAAISGYGGDVDWIDSSAFDMLYLAQLQSNQFTKAGIRAVRNRVMKLAPPLSNELKFRMVMRR